MKTIGIIGVGGVGGYFGGKLCRLQQTDGGTSISFVARGEHLRAIQESGLLLSSESDGDLVCRPSLATDDFRRLPPLDLCLICGKEYDLTAALSGLAPLIGDETISNPNGHRTSRWRFGRSSFSSARMGWYRPPAARRWGRFSRTRG